MISCSHAIVALIPRPGPVLKPSLITSYNPFSHDQVGVEPSHLYHLMQLDLEELQRASASGRAGLRESEPGDAAGTAAPTLGSDVEMATAAEELHSQQEGVRHAKRMGSAVTFNPAQSGTISNDNNDDGGHGIKSSQNLSGSQQQREESPTRHHTSPSRFARTDSSAASGGLGGGQNGVSPGRLSGRSPQRSPQRSPSRRGTGSVTGTPRGKASWDGLGNHNL